MAERPATRTERQEQTRTALVHAAREVFARDGFHGARLEQIAAKAGYSKGAVYSNFDSKATLFLAVMDLNLEAVRHGPGESHAAGLDDLGAAERAQLAEVMSGFGLATLEFIAAAGRDGELRAALGERVQAMLERYYAPHVAGGRSPDDELAVGEIALLVAALDQGAALLTLGGSTAMNQRLLRAGMQRLVEGGRPGRAADDPDSTDDDPALHPADLQRRIADSIRD